jgi:hypothetical protein
MNKKIGIWVLVIVSALFPYEMKSGLSFEFSPALIYINTDHSLYSIDFSPEYAMFVAGGEAGLFISYNGLEWENSFFTETRVYETEFAGDKLYVGTGFTLERRHGIRGFKKFFKQVRPYLYRKRYRGSLYRLNVADLNSYQPIAQCRTVFGIKVFSTDYFGCPLFGRTRVNDVLEYDNTLYVQTTSRKGNNPKCYMTRGNFYKNEVRKVDTHGDILDINSDNTGVLFSGIAENNFQKKETGNIGFLLPGDEFAYQLANTDTIVKTRFLQRKFFVVARDTSGYTTIYRKSADYSGGSGFIPVLKYPVAEEPIDIGTNGKYIFVLCKSGTILYSFAENDNIWYNAEVRGFETTGENREMTVVNDMIFVATNYGVYRSGINFSKRNIEPVPNLANPKPNLNALQQNATDVNETPILNVDPNPAINRLNILIEIFKPSVYNLKIYDLSEKKYLVFDDKFIAKGKYSLTFSTKDLPPGDYNLKIEAPGIKNHYSFGIRP